MKKIKLVFVISLMLITGFMSGQDSTGNKIPIGERKMTFYAAGKVDAHEGAGWNLGLNIQNLPVKARILQRVYVGLNITKQANLGFEIGLTPLNKSWGKVKYFNTLGLLFHDRNVLFTPHDSLVSGSIGKPGKMIAAFQLGCNLEFLDRVGLFATFDPGISFYPNAKFSWRSNGYWYWGAEGGIYFLFGGLKKKKDVTMNSSINNLKHTAMLRVFFISNLH